MPTTPTYITVRKGQTSSGLVINDNEVLSVASGGKVVDCTINPGGQAAILEGATASGLVENGGFVQDEKPKGTFASNTFSGLVISSTGVGPSPQYIPVVTI